MSTTLMSQQKAESESEMLPQDPPPRIIGGIAWLLVAIFFTGLIAAITFHLPETVSAAFVLVPQNGADPIQSSRLAVVSAVKVSEGEAVKAGQELFILRSDEIRGLSTQLNGLTEDLRTK